MNSIAFWLGLLGIIPLGYLFGPIGVCVQLVFAGIAVGNFIRVLEGKCYE